MKVLFLTEGRDVPAGRFRVEQLVPSLEKAGIRCYVSRAFPPKYYLPAWHRKKYVGRLAALFYLALKTADRFLAVLRAPFYDAVFLQRGLLPWPDRPVLERLLRSLSKKLIFDFDDAIYVNAPAKTAAAAGMSDLVIAGNGYLKTYALKYNPRVEVVPSCVDTGVYTPGRAAGGDRATIGWMGSSSEMKNLAAAGNGLADAVAEGEAELFLVSDLLPPLPFLTGVRPRYKKWTAASELEDLRAFDVGIMPLEDTEVARGKCGFKLLLCMSCGVPVIASPVGANRDIVKDGENGFLASSAAEWKEKLTALIRDPGLRRRIGAAGRLTVEARYSVKANAPVLAGIIKKI